MAVCHWLKSAYRGSGPESQFRLRQNATSCTLVDSNQRFRGSTKKYSLLYKLFLDLMNFSSNSINKLGIECYLLLKLKLGSLYLNYNVGNTYPASLRRFNGGKCSQIIFYDLEHRYRSVGVECSGIYTLCCRTYLNLIELNLNLEHTAYDGPNS